VLFRVLGPLEVWDGTDWRTIRAAQQRTVLAVLLIEAGRVVTIDRLLDELWGGHPPATAVSTVQGYVMRLRRLLGKQPGARRLLTQAPGYRLLVGDEELDAAVFERLVESGQRELAAGRLGPAAEQLRGALAMWRGPAFADVPAGPTVDAESGRLEQRRLVATEAHIDADLGLGRHSSVVTQLDRLVAEHPLRERFRGQLMLALYRCGRRADALEAYRQGRRALVDELGMEPGPELSKLEQAILTDDPALAAPPPALPPARTVPAQLPADLAMFTGRSSQVAQLDVLLPDPAGQAGAAVVISAIAGTAGVGKTALAIHWAHRMRDQFADGQLYVDLRGYAPTPPMRPIEALAQFLHALGVPGEQVPVDVDEAAGLYRTLLADKRVLVLLDNARAPDQVRPLLPGSSGSMVLVTSRDRLAGLVARDGARRVAIDVLPPAEAADLLARVLGRDRVVAEPDATAELAHACAYLPLALRIAAADLADDPDRGIAQYVAELNEGNRLAALEVVGDEQTAVRAAFGLSYAALPADVRGMFRLFGLARGPDITVEAAAALAGVAPQRARRLLDRLMAAHLLGHHGPGRYAGHDLLRLYAAERAEQEDNVADRQAAIKRLHDYYLRTTSAAAQLLYPTTLRLPLPPGVSSPAQAIFDDYTQALAWLEAERANLVASVRHAAEHGPRPAAWLLADALRGFFHLRVYTVDWPMVAQAGLAAAAAEGDVAAQSAAQLNLADVHRRQGRYQQAAEHYDLALALAQQAGWQDGQAAALGNLGNVHWQSGRLGEAADHYAQAQALDRQSGRLAGQAASLGNLGGVYWELGRLEGAADHYAQALALFRKLDSRYGEAICLGGLGESQLSLGLLEEAHDHLTQALTLHRETGDRGNEAKTLRVLAELHRDQGRSFDARRLAQAALTLAHDTGERRLEADALNALASLDEPARAVERYEDARRMARTSGSRYPEVVALIGLAAAQEQVGHPDQALASAEQAVQLARAAGHRLLEGQAAAVLAGLQPRHNPP
jgi:DNA-binding SARP family transcriptional activator